MPAARHETPEETPWGCLSEIAGPVQVSIDSNGNLTSKTEGSDNWVYTWNAEDRLTKVEKNGNEVARFAYDPSGRRVEKVAGGVATSYAYDGSAMVRESRGASTLKYVQGAGIDEVLAADDGASLTYFHSDGLGSIVKQTSASGAVTLVRQYDAWGNLELGADQSGFAFTGREWDSEIGSYYYRARYYDPKAGRFIGEDPIRWSGGHNFYRYVDDAPTIAGDPSGLSAFLRCETIPTTRGGGVLGAVVLGVAQARHCYIEVICPGKYHVTIELYGPQPGFPNGQPAMNPPNAARNNNSSTSTIYPPTCGKDPTVYDCPNASKNCNFEDELLMQFVLQVPPPYNPQGPNSNTFAANVIGGAGGRATFPSTAYGCDYKKK